MKDTTDLHLINNYIYNASTLFKLIQKSERISNPEIKELLKLIVDNEPSVLEALDKIKSME